MLRTYDIPYQPRYSVQSRWNEKTRSTVCGNSIWIFNTCCDNETGQVVSELIVINTETLEATNINCDLINDTGCGISKIAFHADKLFILSNPIDEEDDDEDNEEQTYLLYTLDTKSMVFAKVFEFRANLLSSLVVLGDTIYSIDWDFENDRMYLLKIELLEKIVASKHLLNGIFAFGSQTLQKYDNKLYLITALKDQTPMAHLIKDDKPPQLVSAADHVWDSIFGKFNFCLYNRFRETSWVLKDLPAYNFNGKTFIDHFMGSMQSHFFLRCMEQIGDTVYLVARDDTCAKYFVKVLLLKPKLEEICMIQLADGLAGKDDSEIENVHDMLPIELRKKLKNLVGHTEIIMADNENHEGNFNNIS